MTANCKTIGVVTTSRADYGIYLPVLRALAEHPELDPVLLVSGMHLSPVHGRTVETIEADGWNIAHRVECLEEGDTPADMARSMSRGLAGFGDVFQSWRPDLLVVLGDRFEMFAAAVASVPFRIPVAHIHGGELTYGAIDDVFRHCLTKLSHLHFVSTQDYRHRVIQMGEQPWRVIVTGAPSLDNIGRMDLLGIDELSLRFGLDLNQPPILVTFHPVTMEHGDESHQISELLAALKQATAPIMFTMPNADAGNAVIRRMILDFVATNDRAYQVNNMGSLVYFSFMNLAQAMVGNSSSGIIEAASFKLPVVNIGTRQDGRTRAANVIDTGYGRDEIVRGINRATSNDFKAELTELVNPYGDGQAARRIATCLADISYDARFIGKIFHDLETL